MAYQTKYHSYICNFFKYLSFVMVVVTLFVWLLSFWVEWPSFHFVEKLVVTTISVLLASVAIKIIFIDDSIEAENQNKIGK